MLQHYFNNINIPNENRLKLYSILNYTGPEIMQAAILLYLTLTVLSVAGVQSAQRAAGRIRRAAHRRRRRLAHGRRLSAQTAAAALRRHARQGARPSGRLQGEPHFILLQSYIPDLT